MLLTESKSTVQFTIIEALDLGTKFNFPKGINAINSILRETTRVIIDTVIEIHCNECCYCFQFY